MGVDFAKVFKQRLGANTPVSRTCMFVICDRPYGPDPWCGQPAVAGFSYCQNHKDLCYRPMDDDASRAFNRHTAYVARITR